MPGRVRFVCVLHAHQPVGNFDWVIEDAYKKSYLPYVEVFEEFPEIAVCHHYSGCLLEWLEKNHPEYMERLKRNCAPASDQNGAHNPWEMIGGGFYDPIMTMLPERDRLAQIRNLAAYLENHFGQRPRGCWLPERVWEPGLVKDLADAGVEYLTLDDSHFRAAGLEENQLTGGFVTEDQGRILRVYPASEKLRYFIPFKSVEDCLGVLRSLAPEEGERVVCYADDGEKFGIWPHTYEHVYTNGWLKNFLTALTAAQKEGWLRTSTLADAFTTNAPVGRIFIPENSYREMTEWAWPATRLAAYEKAREAVRQDGALAQNANVQQLVALVKGGNWRYFKAKYQEANRMYAKMMEVSDKVAQLPQKTAEEARTHLYRGQCNCPYWHGKFGGLYLPHLRSAIYSELIQADKLADEMLKTPQLSGTVHDFDFDGAAEVKLANAHLAVYLHPARGGHLYELDLRDINFNAADTLSRRYEAYHEQVRSATVDNGNQTGSIHDLVLAKQAGLEKLLQYDSYPRESLVDHLSPRALTTADLLSGSPPSDPGFRQGVYVAGPVEPAPRPRAALRKLVPTASAGLSVELTRRAQWNGTVVQVRKRIIVRKQSCFEIEYEVAHLGGEPVEGFFAVEMNYSLLAGDAPDRYFFHEKSENAGKLASEADFGKLAFVGLKDEWLNLKLTLRPMEPAQTLVCPVRTVSSSEGGFETVYQNSSVVLQWPIKLLPASAPPAKGAHPSVFAVTLLQEIGRARE